MMKDPIFALDIGTRTVTGIIMKQNDDHEFALIDYCTKEHKVRSMHDGQIHNVMEVAKVIKEVKETMEKEHVLTNVSVAAAGRSLKTITSSASFPLNGQPIADQEMIKHLELTAVHSAQATLARESSSDFANYYCVGYSVLNYKLDNEIIGSLIDQTGEEASVEVIATFLPKVVVESLLAALERAHLEMEALTLEPIAAIHVLIPESMRKLNVALVDIGAGTSDIAITDKGTVVAYGMVPFAGDEITEAISEKYLLDFPMAEQAKKNIVMHGEDTVYNILGFETKIDYAMLTEDIGAAIEKLAALIAEEILRLNSKSPMAVMLIGGGSLTPEIATLLARKLQLPENRVAIRGMDAIPMLANKDDLPNRPDLVTPVGIATLAHQNPVHYITVEVNETIIRMFEMKELTVGDCLVQAGLEINKLYGKPGIAYFITVNGKEMTLPGELGKPPAITCNGNPVAVDAVIQNGDKISVEKGADGNSPNVTLEQLFGELPVKHIYFNEEQYMLEPKLIVNNRPAAKNDLIQDKDQIILEQVETIKDFLQETGIKLSRSESFPVMVNNRNINLAIAETKLLLNGEKAQAADLLKNNDHLIIQEGKEPALQALLKQLGLAYWDKIQVQFNDQNIQMKQKKLYVTRNGIEITPETTLHRKDELLVKTLDPGPFIFQDVFRYVELDLTHARGKFHLYKNNEPSAFDDFINDGDILAIEWENKQTD